jgi:hypothetical protein
MERFGGCAWFIVVASLSAGCGSNDASPVAETGGDGGTAGGGPGGGTTGGGGSGGGQVGTGGAADGSAGAPLSGALPEGNDGIAAKHPGDVGIDADPAVLFADDFERYAKASELNTRYDAVYQNQYVTITTDAANVYAGKQALELTLPQQTAELSDSVDKKLSPEQDVLFLRYYSKFQPP